MSEAAPPTVGDDAVDFGIERILREIERVSDPATKMLVRELVASVLDLHAAGLRRMLEIVAQAATGAASLRNAFEQDALVRLLLVLHDLSAFSPQQRVQQALEELQPYLRQTGAAATLLHLDENAVEVRLTMPGNAEAAAVEHVRRRIERALMEVAPSLAGIEVTVRPMAVGLIPVSALGAAPRSTE